jgi:tetratricopeptide (TPR) repeat protein
MSLPDRIDPILAADIDRLATTFAKDPRSKAFMPLAESYIKAGMWQEAAGVLEDGLAVYPGFVTAMAALGRVYDQVGQPAKAKAILEDVVKQSPENLRAHRILARIFAAEGNADSALKSCGAILAVSPHDEEALTIQRKMAGRPAGGDQAVPEARPSAAGAVTEPEVSAQLEPGVPDAAADQAVRTAAAVARLQAWLHTIQSRRHGGVR